MNLKVDINVCRVCLKSENGITIQNDINILEKFQYITQLKIRENDGMPSLLCNICIARLKIAHEFRKQAIISDTHLRAFINKINNQFKEVASTSFASSKLIMNEDEMQLLVDAGYKTDVVTENEPIGIEERSVKTQTKLQEIQEEDQNAVVMDEDLSQHIHHIEDFSFIQEDDVGDAEEADADGMVDGDGNVDDDDDDNNEEDAADGDEENPYCDEDDNEDEREIHLEEGNLSGGITVENISVKDESLSDGNITQNQEHYIISNLKDNGPLEKPKNENRSHICIKCDKDFSTKTNLMRHMLTHDGVKPFQCNICGNGFTQNGSLKQHMLIHSGERPHKCDVCGRGFTQAKSLVFHMRRHTGEKPFACDKCGLTFRQKDGLKRHGQMKHSGAPTEVHICSICNRVLQSRYSLALHMKKHLGHQDGGRHKCEVCERTFSTKASLEAHNRQHTGVKPFKCETCGREFSRRSTLVTHAKIHLGDKPYKCNACDKGFVQKHQIEAHMHNHKNQPAKTFQCGKCNKSFAIKRNLLQHLRNHNRDSMTIFKCEECSIAFNTKRGLKLHRFNEHKEAVSDLNECDICNIPFVSVNDLNQHMITVHDTIDEKCDICLQHFTSKKLMEDHLLEHELLTIG